MPAALVKMYETLTSQQQEQVYNYIFSFYQTNSQPQNKSKFFSAKGKIHLDPNEVTKNREFFRFVIS